MILRSNFAKWLGILLIAFGIGMGLYLSGTMTWGEMETNRGAVPADSKSLSLTCPLMMSFKETGVIKTQIINELDREVKPQVTASFGQPDTSQQTRIVQTHILSPKETQTIQWQVDSSAAAFGRIIPVVILQSRYNLNPPRSGSCAILLFSLFGLSGIQTLTLIISVSVLSIIAGILLIRPYLTTQEGLQKNITQMTSLLILLTLAAIMSALFRRWGLTILIETIGAITIGTLITELIVPQHKSN